MTQLCRLLSQWAARESIIYLPWHHLWQNEKLKQDEGERQKQSDWFWLKSLLSWPVAWLHVSGLQLRDNVKHMVRPICFLIQDATTAKQHSLKLQCSFLQGNVEVSFQHMSNICEKLKTSLLQFTYQVTLKGPVSGTASSLSVKSHA